ncbi:MAG: FecR domain-containing protein [Chitinophaga sp.]|uniref:FecR family protein n=1 Tax=Chitinophaga sp. TaxID=1869181 RepID=UPI0025BEAEEE|nr:FecR family protein [Chitinophaga sp.]MBV8255286.1 FecR domain-containing protein [Chitinophaga sp.]
MPIDKAYITRLLDQHIAGTLNQENQQVLNAAIRAASAADREWMMQYLENALATTHVPAAPDQQLYERILYRIQQSEKELHTVKPIRSIYYAVAAAAGLLLLVTSGLIWQQRSHQKDFPPMVIMPGTNKATLILADGSHVQLDSTTKEIAQGNTAVRQQEGALKYSKNSHTTTTYNTLNTPRGGQFQVELADGSHIWLNAASSLRYPAAFNDSERVVTLSGEAYFDIKPDPQRPFHVVCGNTTIQVLGTSFNIMAYTDEPNLQASLVEGKIMVKAAGSERIIRPGQMAVTDQYSLYVAEADLDQVTAWRNGMLALNTTSFKGLMRQVERWYDVEVVYQGEIPDRQFGGLLSRNTQLSTLLAFMRKNGINVKQEGRTITVMP